MRWQRVRPHVNVCCCNRSRLPTAERSAAGRPPLRLRLGLGLSVCVARLASQSCGVLCSMVPCTMLNGVLCTQVPCALLQCATAGRDSPQRKARKAVPDFRPERKHQLCVFGPCGFDQSAACHAQRNGPADVLRCAALQSPSRASAAALHRRHCFCVAGHKCDGTVCVQLTAPADSGLCGGAEDYGGSAAVGRCPSPVRESAADFCVLSTA